MKHALRRIGLVPWFTVMALIAACSGGASREPATSPGEPLLGLGEAELGRFLLGKAVFERLVVADEGLGPLFNAERCSACHDVPATGGSGNLLVVKATRWDGTRCDALEAEGGDNIQQRATPLLAATGITAESIPHRANGQTKLTSPPLFGLGLIAAIADGELLSREDPEDANGDGISGRAGRTRDGMPGRFSRKSDIATIADFVDTALRFEVGLTTSRHPYEETVNGVALPDGVDPMPEPEIDEHGLALLSDFVAFLAPPPREQLAGIVADSAVIGERLFEQAGCASCHVPSIRTASNAAQVLANRNAELYSDLLLHDMGPDLADVCGTNASPSEWRTPLLWGLRYRSRLLHDGRAASPRDAILSHGGEAQRSRDAFTRMNAADQARLLRFLASL